MFYLRKDLTPRHTVTLQFIGYDHAGFVLQTLQKPLEESFGGLRIPPRLNENVEHDTILVYGPPEVVLYSLDANEHLVHIPLVPRRWPAAAHAGGETLTEFLTPTPHRLVGDDHAPFGQDQLNVTETETEHVVEPDGMADDLRREAMTVMRVGRRLHAVSLAGFGLPGQTELT